MSGTTFRCNNETIEEDNATVYGNMNMVTGARATVVGDRNTVTGDESTITGDLNLVSGNAVVVNGTQNTVTGDPRAVVGESNFVAERPAHAPPSAATAAAAAAAAARHIRGPARVVNTDAWTGISDEGDASVRGSQPLRRWHVPRAINDDGERWRASHASNALRMRGAHPFGPALTFGPSRTTGPTMDVSLPGVHAVVGSLSMAFTTGPGVEFSVSGAHAGVPTSNEDVRMGDAARRVAPAPPPPAGSLDHILREMQERDRALDADADDRVQCTICCERIKCVALDPCGHVETCAECTRVLVKPGGAVLDCPICKAVVRKVAFARV